jgi:hypothetical protein
MLALVNPESQALEEQPRPMLNVASHARRGDAPNPPKRDGRIRLNSPVSNRRSATSSRAMFSWGIACRHRTLYRRIRVTRTLGRPRDKGMLSVEDGFTILARDLDD